MRIVPRHERHEQRARDLAKVIAIVEGTNTAAPDPRARRVASRSAEGDTLRLRGWPIVARGVAGMSTESRRMLNEIEARPLRSVI